MRTWCKRFATSPRCSRSNEPPRSPSADDHAVRHQVADLARCTGFTLERAGKVPHLPANRLGLLQRARCWSRPRTDQPVSPRAFVRRTLLCDPSRSPIRIPCRPAHSIRPSRAALKPLANAFRPGRRQACAKPATAALVTWLRARVVRHALGRSATWSRSSTSRPETSSPSCRRHQRRPPDHARRPDAGKERRRAHQRWWQARGRSLPASRYFEFSLAERQRRARWMRAWCRIWPLV